MNLATPFQFDSFTLLTFAETTIRNTREAAAHSNRIIKAFSKTITPQIVATAKDLSHYYIECGQGAGAWAMAAAGITHNPLQSAVRSAHAELTSAEAQATYRRVRHIVREAAMDALIVGLCGVVAVSVGVDVAQKGYRAAAKLYQGVYDRLNPSEPMSELLPSVGMAIASTELAAALAEVADIVEAKAIQPTGMDELVPDVWSEQIPLIQTPPVVGSMWNPAPGRDIHAEVARLFALQHVPLTLPVAPEAQVPAVDDLASSIEVPGAAGVPKRQCKTSPGEVAVTKPKRTRAGVGTKAGAK
jgi:hypothetical protein